MSDVKEQLQRALDRFVKDRVPLATFLATVKGYDEDFNTVTVVDADGLEIFDVQMAAIVGFGVSLYLKPNVGSTVLVASVGNSESRFLVVACADLENFGVEVGATKFAVASDGILIERNAQSLKTVLGELIEQVKLITVTATSFGTPTGFPNNAALFDPIKAKIDAILK